MKESNIIICEPDAGYAKAVVQAFQKNKQFEANYIILTDQNKLLSYIKEGQALLYLISEEAYQKTIVPYLKEVNEKDKMKLEQQLFVFTDQAATQYESIQCIFKYQPVTKIIEPVTVWVLEQFGEFVTTNQNVKVIGIMDYAGDSAGLFGHLAAKIYSESKRVLFVTMELFPFQFTAQKTEYTLSDYIYAVSTGSECASQIASGMQYQEENLHMVSPIQCFEDLHELKAGDISKFLKQLKEQGGCDYIVLVIDFLRDFALELLSGCDAIISCESGNLVSLKKKEQFYQMLALEQKEWLFEKISSCTVTSDYLLSQISKEGELTPQIRSLFYDYLFTVAS